jgi:hypothetical protein
MRTEGLELRVCVPVSVRTDEDHNAFGNKLVQILCPLPVYVADPIDRLRFVAENMHGLKHSKQALGAEAIASAEDFAPPTILARATRMNFSTRFYNLLVTNVPGRRCRCTSSDGAWTASSPCRSSPATARWPSR